MKKIILGSIVSLLFPLVSFASTDSVTINVANGCGTQFYSVSGTATYNLGDHLIVTKNGSTILADYSQNPIWAALAQYLTNGSYNFEADIVSGGTTYVIATQSVTINDCPVLTPQVQMGQFNSGQRHANVVFINGNLYASHILTKDQLTADVLNGTIK